MSRHILITGSAGGIGCSIARRFLREGWIVTGIDRAEGAIEHENYTHDTLDITDEIAMNRAFGQATSRAQLTAVIANAAVTDMGHHCVSDLNYETWQNVLRVNVDGAFLTARAAARSMVSGGNIIFITSSLAFADNAIANDAPYSASKAAVEMLKQVLALELIPSGINVNTLFPSAKIATGFFSHLPAHQQTDLAPANILDETALFLAGLAPGVLTGVSLDQARWDSDPSYRKMLEEGKMT